MREIKFRAWDIKERKMDYDIPLHDEFGTLKGAISRASHYYPVMQFTGLKDKNGKEIYEGDLLAFYNGMVREVCWENAGFHTRNAEFKIAPMFLDRNTTPESEIIGNIYENPELIK